MNTHPFSKKILFILSLAISISSAMAQQPPVPPAAVSPPPLPLPPGEAALMVPRPPRLPAYLPPGVINPTTGLPVQMPPVDRTLLDQNNQAQAAIDPQTGLPVQPPEVATMNQTSPMIDPQTGLPLVQPWKDANWTDPDIILTNVDYDGLPISEVVHQLSNLFSNQFDLLLPQDYGPGPDSNNNPNWLDTSVHLKLHHVNASEVFSAMNLLFNDDRIPLLWELKMNGSRRTVLLRVLQDPKSRQFPDQPELKRVFFVGDMLDGRRPDDQEMEDIVNQVRDIWRMAFVRDSKIQYHAEAQIIVVSGTPDEIEFVEQTLQAMKKKMAVDQHKAILKEMSQQHSNTNGP